MGWEIKVFWIKTKQNSFLVTFVCEMAIHPNNTPPQTKAVRKMVRPVSNHAHKVHVLGYNYIAVFQSLECVLCISLGITLS